MTFRPRVRFLDYFTDRTVSNEPRPTVVDALNRPFELGVVLTSETGKTIDIPFERRLVGKNFRISTTYDWKTHPEKT